jgi:hypothetical protein
MNGGSMTAAEWVVRSPVSHAIQTAEDREMKVLSAIITGTALLAAPAFANAEQAHFKIVGSPEFQGNCGGITPIINTLEGNPSMDVLFTDMSVEASGRNDKERKLCNIRLRVEIEPGYSLSLTKVIYQGKVDTDTDGASANVSARAFFHGLPGIDGFARFGSGQGQNFTVVAEQDTPDTVCGGTTALNLLVDLSARTTDGQFSEIAIQRAAGTPGPTGKKSRIECEVEQTPCGH